MASISDCAKADEADLLGQLTPVIEVGDEEDTVAKLIEWPRLKGSRVEYPTGSSRFREFCKAKSSIDGIWGHAFAYRVILVCKTLNGRLAASGSKRRITAKDFLEYYAVKYVTATDGAYLSSSSSRQCFFDLSSAGRVWNGNLLWVSGECLQLSDEEPLELNNRTISKGIFYRRHCQGTELKAVLNEFEITRFERVASREKKVRRSQTKRRLVGKTPGSMEEKLSTPKLNTPLKLVRLNEIPDGPVDVATVFSTIIRKLAKRMAEVPEENDKIAEGANLRPRFEVEAGFLEEQCRAKAREKMVVVMDDEFKKLERDKEWEAASLKLKEVWAESKAEAERLVTVSAISRNNLAGNPYQLRYTKAEIMAFSEGNYEEIEIMDEEVVVEREDGLNVTEKTAADNQESINQEIESSRLRVEDIEGLLKVERKSSAELQEKAASSSRHEAEVAESRIRALNEEISDMKCNIRALNEQLLKREIELDTARTNLAVSEADFEKLSSSIMGKDQEFRNSAQIRDSLIARVDRVKADLRHLKGREAQSRADLTEIQAKNKSLVDDLAHARENVRRAVQREKEMNKIINQLYARIFESERELRVREMKYQKDLKFELDKRDGEIASGEGSREMKEFLRRKKELVENMHIDLINSQQKLIDLTRQMSDRIDQLTAELAESKARRLKDNKRTAVTHQSF
ncbi:hypothetical protein GIB67_042456 [Kingdonia uniflora]|uniref:Uncharacterized protein n=1 Tax=Kingdonia uniflora TaxID=39325 RepID=A0A7J7M0X2_9MAGN|nr:hypothetical protein GIB67_042456 [Kingdonia uniflora]